MQESELRDDIADEQEMFYPYPNPVMAAGLLIWGDGTYLPLGSAIELLKSRENAEEYELTVNVTVPENYPKMGMSALKCMDQIMTAVGMLPLWELLDDPGHAFCQELDAQEVSSGSECMFHMTMGREDYKQLFREIAESDYVQLFPDVDVLYVIDAVPALTQWQLKRVYRSFFPLARNAEDVEVMPMLDRELELMGFITYNPYHVFTVTEDGFECLTREFNCWTNWWADDEWEV